MSGRDTLRLLQAEYGVADAAATVIYEGTKRFPESSVWTMSSVVVIAPSAGSVVLRGAEGNSATFSLEASPEPQCISLPGLTDRLTVESSVPGLICLGAYLDGDVGVQVDCMSVRGNSGIAMRNTSLALTAAVRPWVDYDFIIVEYGINALSPGQNDYSAYSNAMGNVLERLKACYPESDVLLLGISDRGAKNGSAVNSLPACRHMVDAQRKAAHRAGVCFWDMRQAMGGEDAVVEWRRRKLMNADYIHLNP
ncbi:MAG: hypothetical protein K2F79_01010, partial [Muribaculaceae bacterium]|nr:hypothetical protein [Muribaculaceae bacterium]